MDSEWWLSQEFTTQRASIESVQQLLHLKLSCRRHFFTKLMHTQLQCPEHSWLYRGHREMLPHLLLGDRAHTIDTQWPFNVLGHHHRLISLYLI